MTRTKKSSKKNKHFELTVAECIIWLIKLVFNILSVVTRILYYVVRCLVITSYNFARHIYIQVYSYLSSYDYIRIKKLPIRFIKFCLKCKDNSIFKLKQKHLPAENHQRSFLLDILSEEMEPKEVDKLLVKKGEHPFLKLVK